MKKIGENELYKMLTDIAGEKNDVLVQSKVKIAIKIRDAMREFALKFSGDIDTFADVENGSLNIVAVMPDAYVMTKDEVEFFKMLLENCGSGKGELSFESENNEIKISFRVIGAFIPSSLVNN